VVAVRSSSAPIYAALAGGIAVSATKLIAAAVTGSSGMFSEGLHSLVDTSDELLLLYGKHRASQPPDEMHPFGHGQELYFWTLIVSLLIFTGGGAVSMYEGVQRVLHPSALGASMWNYIVLALAGVFEGASFVVGYRQMRKLFPDCTLLEVVHVSTDPTLFTVVLEDISDLIGLSFAFFGILLSDLLHMPVFDGIASILIGLLLSAVAFVLVRESRGLLTGESVGKPMRLRIRDILRADPDVRAVNTPLTVHFGPDSVLLAVEIQFRDGLASRAVADAIQRIEGAVRAEYPKVTHIFIEAEAIRSSAM